MIELPRDPIARGFYVGPPGAEPGIAFGHSLPKLVEKHCNESVPIVFKRWRIFRFVGYAAPVRRKRFAVNLERVILLPESRHAQAIISAAGRLIRVTENGQLLQAASHVP